MQFKSILAVLALAVAVSATPVQPTILERTNTPQQTCQNIGKFASKCSVNNVDKTATQSLNLLSILTLALSLILNPQCTIGGNNIPIGSDQTALCCTTTNGDPSNSQTGIILVNFQDINALNCVAVPIV